MKEFALLVDVALYGLLALTVALSLWKGLELSMPARFGHDLSPSDEPALQEVVEKLEAWLALLAIVASGAAFVGLAGTVAHIITALSNLKGSALDITLISGPIATSLRATLLGLASAIPASVVYSLAQRRLQVLENRMRRAWARSAK